MKKILAILMGAAMILSLAACGAKTDDQTTTAADESETVSIVNPITEVDSLEELNNQTGAFFRTPGVMGVTDEAYLITDCGDYKIASYKYTVNDKECEIRFSANLEEDISGFYIDGKTAFADSETGKEDKVVTDTAALARWFTVDGQYVFIYEADEIDESVFDEVVNDAKAASLDNGAEDQSDVHSIVAVKSLEELNEQTGAKFTTPGVMGVTDETYLMEDCGDYKIAVYKYTVNDKKIQVRFSAYLEDDISGYKIDDKTAFADSATGEEDQVITDTAALARWFTVDGQYVFVYEADSIDESIFNEVLSEAKTASLENAED